MSALTDDQCAEFRRMPGSFNDMVRAIYAAGASSAPTDHIEDARQMVGAAPVQAQDSDLDDLIERLWLYRANTYGGELMPQLQDFARALLAAQPASDARRHVWLEAKPDALWLHFEIGGRKAKLNIDAIAEDRGPMTRNIMAEAIAALKEQS